MSAARSGSESSRMCSSSAWAPAPRGPRPSRVGIPSAAVKLPSLPPPVDPSVSSNPNAAARASWQAFSKRAALAGVRSIGGRLKDPANCQAILGVLGAKLSQGRFDPCFFRAGGDPDVDLGRRVCGDDVAGGAATDHADVDGGSGGEVLQLFEFQDLVGELDDRVASLLGCDAGMGGLALHVKMESADPLPRGLEPAVGQSRFEHQHIGGLDGRASQSASATSGCRSPHRR